MMKLLMNRIHYNVTINNDNEDADNSYNNTVRLTVNMSLRLNFTVGRRFCLCETMSTTKH